MFGEDGHLLCGEYIWFCCVECSCWKL